MKKGFTLIEVVAVLLLVGVLALASTIGMVPVVDAFLQVRQNAESAQKTHLALERIAREFTTITEVIAADAQAITYDFLDPEGVAHRRQLIWEGSGMPLRLNGVPLSNDVGHLELRYYPAPDGVGRASWAEDCCLIELFLRPEAGPDRYRIRVQPRNLPMNR